MTKTAVITGITGGIGKALLKELHQEGYNVIGLYNKNDEEASKLQKSYSIQTYKVNLADSGEINAAIKDIIFRYKNVDILVNNAGIAQQKLFTDCSEKDISDMLDINLKGAMLLTKAVIPVMVSNKYGKIINISSIWGVMGGSCETHYSASKAGLIGFTKALSRELGLSNINVNCIAPGFIETEMNDNISESDKSAFISETSLQRAGKACDVAHLVSFLASDKASYITGQVIAIDGGI